MEPQRTPRTGRERVGEWSVASEQWSVMPKAEEGKSLHESRAIYSLEVFLQHVDLHQRGSRWVGSTVKSQCVVSRPTTVSAEWPRKSAMVALHEARDVVWLVSAAIDGFCGCGMRRDYQPDAKTAKSSDFALISAFVSRVRERIVAGCDKG